MSLQIFVLLLALCSLFQLPLKVDGITCHVCESNYEEAQFSTRFFDTCQNKRDWKVEICPEVYDSCYIHTTNYTETVSGQVMRIHKVLRGCTIGDHCGDMKRPSNDKLPNVFNIYSDCYTCKSDFCNAENAAVLTLPSVIFMTIIGFFVVNFNYE